MWLKERWRERQGGRKEERGLTGSGERERGGGGGRESKGKIGRGVKGGDEQCLRECLRLFSPYGRLKDKKSKVE